MSDTPDTPDTAILTDEQKKAQIEALRIQVQQYDAEVAAAEAAERAAKLAPLRAVLDSPEYDGVLQGLADVFNTGQYDDEPNIHPHLQALVSIMPTLKTLAV